MLLLVCVTSQGANRGQLRRSIFAPEIFRRCAKCSERFSARSRMFASIERLNDDLKEVDARPAYTLADHSSYWLLVRAAVLCCSVLRCQRQF